MTRSVRKGRPWGHPATGSPDLEIDGDDRALARVAEEHAGCLVRFRPSAGSDLARALGIGATSPPGSTEVAIDALDVRFDGSPTTRAVNAVVFGTAPDRSRWTSAARSLTVTVDGRERFAGRAFGVVVATGQYLRGLDAVPRGHPGDGRVEIQVYALGRGERRGMRRRLPQGAHVPHPRIHEWSGRSVEVRLRRLSWALEVDGHRVGRGPAVGVVVVPQAVRVLV